MRRKGKKIIIISFIFLIGLSSYASVKTPAEEVNYTQYSQHEGITQFLSRLDSLSEEMTVQVIGQTKESKSYPPQDIYLCIINGEKVDLPSKLNRNKPTLFLTASQHGNEQSAKEAALLLIRDLTVGELKPLLQKLNFLVVPQTNPYGNFFDQRQNGQDLDLNRDHVKLESPEVIALHKVFQDWMPEVSIDVHEKGDDFYRVSIGCVSNVNIHPHVQDFSRKKILTELKDKLKKKGITFYEYLVSQPMGIDSSAGVRYREEETTDREMMRRYSTTDLNDGRNSFGIYETFSFIQEGASRHDIETLRERTQWQYFGLRFFMEAVANNAEKIVDLVSTFRKQLLKRATTFSDEDLVHLQMEYVRDEKEPEITIERFERSEEPIRGILKVDKKAGEPLTQADIAPYRYPPQSKVTTEEVKNWFPGVSPTLSVSRPLGYIIPGTRTDVVETILSHGIKVEMFAKDAVLEVEGYEVLDILPSQYDYLPPQKIEVGKKELQTVVKKGDFYVSCAQPAANLIPCLLEPQSQCGFIRYWKYKLVPEKGSIFPFYRVVNWRDLPLFPYKNWKK